jgi:four helix bundle protein
MLAQRRNMIATRYEELDAWRLADSLKKQVYAALETSAAKEHRGFCDQIRDSANLAEGFGYYRHPEFAKHTRIAKASLHETQNHIGDGLDRKLWTMEKATEMHKLADRAIGACVRLLAHLETTEAPGTKRPAKRRGTTFPKWER